MKESVAIAKEANSKKESSPTKGDNSILSLRNAPERQLGSLRDVLGNIRRDGGTPSVGSLATELSGMPYSDSASALLALQQTHGNRYVQRVVAGIQAKLKVNVPRDRYEQEADRIADEVLRQKMPEEEDEKVDIQARASQQAAGGEREVNEELEKRLSRSKGSGNPISDQVRAFFEPRMKFDFSKVQVHTNNEAAQMNQELGARAFTNGRDIYFGVGQYNPQSIAGKRLLAHELTHVVQQIGQVQGNQCLQSCPSYEKELQREPYEEGAALQLMPAGDAILQSIYRVLTPADGGVIQCDTCQQVYGAPGSSDSTTLVTDREAAKTRVRTNLNSWTPHLLRRLDEEIGNLFSSTQELAWWSNWATGLVVDLLDEAIPKPIGTAIKAIASAGEHIVGQTIADARTALVRAANRAVVDYRTQERTEAESYIDDYFEQIRALTDGECGDYLQLLYDSIEQWWPELTPENYGQLGQLATQLLEQVSARQLQDRIERAYEECVRINLERPGGVPTIEEEAQAREQCRLEAGYTPGGRPGSPP